MGPPPLPANSRHTYTALWCAVAISFASVYGQGQQAPASCTVTGRMASGNTPLPGVALVVKTGGQVVRATSSELDGSYRLALPAGDYQVTAELTGFTAVERSLTLAGEPCVATVVDLQLTLQPRTARGPVAPEATARARFQTLTVEAQEAAQTVEPVATETEAIDTAARLLLPPGFSTDAPTESLTVSGNMASVDRGMMNDRFEALGRGEFDPITGEPGAGFGPPGQPGGRGGPDGGGRGGFGQGGRDGGGRGGRGDFQLAGRGGRQRAYNLQANYNFSGSPLDAAPYALRPGNTPADRDYKRQTIGVTAGGPVRLPGYSGQRRTTFTATYNGNRGDQLFDQYATVPTAAMRDGDFSSLPVQLFDPVTRQPLAGNRLPAASINPAARSLLPIIPLPNLDGTSQNFRYTTTTNTAADNVNVRVTHSFTPVAAGRGGGRGGGGGFGGGRGGGGGPPGRGNQGVGVVLNAQLQYRRNANEQPHVFPTLGGATTGSNLSVPISLNITRRRTLHSVNVNVTRSTNHAQGRYAFATNVAGNAGIAGVSNEPVDWGVPTLSFSSLTSVRDVTPTERTDKRFTLGYTLTRPWRAHTIRVGGDVRIDRADSRTAADARGAFTFTGLYASGGSAAARGGGLDFADFLLGLPQQASVQYGPGLVHMAGKSMSLFVQDDWRRSGALTFNLGVRYELLSPFSETNGRMANLDVPPDFTAAAPVLSGQTGPFTGAFPAALLRADINNIAPRLGAAWRPAPGLVVRGGYGISYNAGSYASIARQMVAQPPFAVTDTRLGTIANPLNLQRAFATARADETKNSYGVDKDYALGLVQTWNGDVSKDWRQVWNVGAGYTHTRGTSLDIVRAPNRGPTGLRIPDVQPFLWQTAEGSSTLHALTLRVRRRAARGLGGGLTYTLARSHDNASTIGGGGTVVAQNDQDLEAEWGLSSFDRRHQLSADASVELPFGPNRRWLANGGMWAALLENWRVSTNFTWQSGTPYTPRMQAAAADVARGTSGTLRANYSGDPIRLNDPTIDRYFNTAAFTVPSVGTFGNASRNLIIGPGSRLLDAQVARDIRLGGTRVLSVSLNANNLLNLVNYAAIDTVVNSRTFGQVVSVRPMRSTQLVLRFRF